MKQTLILALLACHFSAFADLTNGLVAYFPFNGNSVDESAHGRSLANSGAILTVDRLGNHNSAYNFDGTAGMLETNSQDSVVLFSGFTLSCWVLLNDNAVNYSLVRKDGDGSIVIVNQQTRTNSFYVETFGTNASGPVTYSGYAEAPPLKKWCMLTATWDGTNFAQYIDGQLKVTTQHSGVSTSPTAPISVGRSPVYQEPLLGKIDDVRVYDRPLSSDEVQQLYTLESGPRVKFIKAFTLDFSNLTIGSNYVLQASADLTVWTNYSAPFTATNLSFVNTTFWRVEDWNTLFFRLQAAP